MQYSRRIVGPGSLTVVVATLVVLAFSQSASAQLFGGQVVVRNARVVTSAGAVVTDGTILINNGRIVEIGHDVDTPFLAKTIDAGGKTVTPGLIDAWSGLGRSGSARGHDATSNAWDAFDAYDRDAFREALRNGVTSIYVGPGGGPGIGGTGVVIKLAPKKGGAAGKLVEEEAALAVNLGSDQSAIGRAKTFYRVRKQFRKALDYRKALEDYEEDLEEYEEKLEERRKKEAEEEKSEDKKNGNGEKKKGGGKDEKKPPKKEPEPKPEPKPEPEPEPKGAAENADADGFLSYMADTARRRGRGKNGNGKNGEKKAENGKNGEKKEGEEDELTKPTRPAPDRASEVVLKAIDRELPVRIEAHRSEDILNALELADEFGFRLILEGATEAYLLADALAEEEVAVILGPVNRTQRFEDNEYRRHTVRNGAALTEAGVQWTVGSGGRDPMAARFVGLSAQAASGHASVPMPWLQTVTARAAGALGILGHTGRLMPGMEADLVIWDGDPSDPGTKVDRVLVDGSVVYKAPANKSTGGGS